jgi:hypothetical protein
MSEIKTGGPAFPQGIDQGASEAGFPIVEITGGLTVRDYFAAKALQGIIATPDERSIQGTPEEVEAMQTKWIEQDAISAYKFADAMIKAREAKP